MTITLTTDLPIQIVAGAGVKTSQPIFTPEFITDDLVVPLSTQTVTNTLANLYNVSMIGSVIIDATTTESYSIYTVPIGHVFIPIEILFVLQDISGSGGPPSITVKFIDNLGFDEALIDSEMISRFALSGGTFTAGTGYLIGDQIGFLGGAFDVATILVVETIDGSGGVLTYSVSEPGSYVEIPSNPVATNSSGNGTGFTITATWASTQSLFDGITTASQIKTVTNLSETAGYGGMAYEYLTAGQTITAQTIFPSSYTTYALKCLVFGFLYRGI